MNSLNMQMNIDRNRKQPNVSQEPGERKMRSDGYFHGCRIFFWGDEDILKLDGSNGCRILGMC